MPKADVELCIHTEKVVHLSVSTGTIVVRCRKCGEPVK